MVLQKCNNDSILLVREATIIFWELFTVSVNSRKSCNQQFQWVSSDSVKCRYHHEESFQLKLSKWECQNTTIRRYRNGSPLILWNVEVNKKLLRLFFNDRKFDWQNKITKQMKKLFELYLLSNELIEQQYQLSSLIVLSMGSFHWWSNLIDYSPVNNKQFHQKLKIIN